MFNLNNASLNVKFVKIKYHAKFVFKKNRIQTMIVNAFKAILKKMGCVKVIYKTKEIKKFTKNQKK
jgi:hypothetical protein